MSALTLILVGCASKDLNTCDPTNRDMGFIDKINCKFSGDFDKRVDQKQQLILDEEAFNDRLNNAYVQLEKQQKDSDASIKQKQTQLQQTQKNLNSTKKNLDKKVKNQAEIQKELDSIQKEMDQIQNSSKTDAQKQEELVKLKARRDQLAKLLN